MLQNWKVGSITHDACLKPSTLQVETSDVCRYYDKRQPKQTLISHEVPDGPWAKVGIDLFITGVVTTSSMWITTPGFEDIQSAIVTRKLKAQFARHGILERARRSLFQMKLKSSVVIGVSLT